MTRRILALALAGALALAACGSDGDDVASVDDAAVTQSDPDASAPDGDRPDGDPPQRIVSLSPTATEILFAVGAGDQVVAVDDQSDFPAEAPVTDLSGLSPNVEAIADFDPDLVVMQAEGDATEALRTLDIEVVVQPAAASLDDTYAQIEEIGEITGHPDEAARLVEGMRSDIAAIVDGYEPPAEPLTYYHELDPTLYTVTSTTFVGQVYALLGLENVADAHDTTGAGYPQMSAEVIVDADPDLIFLADAECCGESPETLSARPGWDTITAVANGDVYAVDEDQASRWGPRIVDFLRSVASILESVEDRTATSPAAA